MWNQKRYEAGYKQAKYLHETYGGPHAVSEYEHLDGARAVDEFEVGFRTYLNEHKLRSEAA